MKVDAKWTQTTIKKTRNQVKKVEETVVRVVVEVGAVAAAGIVTEKNVPDLVQGPVQKSLNAKDQDQETVTGLAIVSVTADVGVVTAIGLALDTGAVRRGHATLVGVDTGVALTLVPHIVGRGRLS